MPHDHSQFPSMYLPEITIDFGCFAPRLSSNRRKPFLFRQLELNMQIPNPHPILGDQDKLSEGYHLNDTTPLADQRHPASLFFHREAGALPHQLLQQLPKVQTDLQPIPKPPDCISRPSGNPGLPSLRSLVRRSEYPYLQL